MLAAIGEWLHNEVCHPWLRQEKKRGRDPDQPDLFASYSVARDGERDVPVALDRLTRGEKVWLIARGFRPQPASCGRSTGCGGTTGRWSTSTTAAGPPSRSRSTSLRKPRPI